MFIAAVNCDESGTSVAASCDLCPYLFYSDYYGGYDYYYNDGTHCNGDCSWNSDLEECQMKGTLQSVKICPAIFSPPFPTFSPKLWYKLV